MHTRIVANGLIFMIEVCLNHLDTYENKHSTFVYNQRNWFFTEAIFMVAHEGFPIMVTCKTNKQKVEDCMQYL